jgi:hypothetical protein
VHGGDRLSAQHVLAMGHWLKMIRVHAAPMRTRLSTPATGTVVPIVQVPCAMSSLRSGLAGPRRVTSCGAVYVHPYCTSEETDS